MMHLLMLPLLFCAPAEEIDLMGAIPADARIMCYVPSVGETRERLKASAWGQFMEEPQMQAVLDFVMQKSLDGGPDKEEKGLITQLLKESFSGSLAFYICLENIRTGTGVVLVTPGEDRESFDDFCRMYETQLNESEQYTDSTDSYNGMDILIWEKSSPIGSADSPGGTHENGIFWVDTGEVNVFVWQGALEDARDKGIAEVQRVLDRLAGEGETATLEDSKEFMGMRDRFAGPNDLEFYFDLDLWMQAAVDLLVEKWGEDSEEMAIFQDLGLHDMSCIYETVRMGEGEAIELSAFIGLSGEGLIRQFVEFFAGEAPMDHLATTPANAYSVFLLHFDLPGLYSKFLEELEARFEGLYNEYRQAYSEFVINRFKIDPEEEILALLDGTLSFYTLEVPAEELPVPQGAKGEGEKGTENVGGVYFLGIKDMEAFRKNFEKTLRALGVYVSMKKVDFQGHRIYSVQTPMAGMRLHWIYGEDVLAVSASPTAIRSYVRLLAHEDQPSVRGEEDCMDFIDSHPHASLVAMSKTSLMVLSYLELAKVLLKPEEYMNLETMEMEEEAGQELPPFPGKDVVDRHFKGLMGTFVEIHEDGLQFSVVTR